MTQQTTTQPELNGKAEKIPMNRRNYVKSLSERYDSVVDGLQNEGIQNPLDEYDRRDIEHTAKIEFVVDPQNMTFELRDNAGGMTEEVLKNDLLYFEEGTKMDATDTRGSQGQGAAVFLALGDLLEVETMRHGERSTARCTQEDRAFGFKELQSLQEDGSIFRVHGVKEKYMEDLRNVDKMEALIRRYWQKTLERDDVVITYRVKGQTSVSKQIRPYNFEEQENVVEKVTREDVEGVDELEIIVFEERRPEPFKKMMAMNVFGQTIEWMTPQRVNSSSRVLAFAEVSELNGYDFPEHRGFRNHDDVSRIRNNVKNAIRSKMDEYRDKTETTHKQDEQIKEAVQSLNDVMEGTEFEQVFSNNQKRDKRKKTTKDYNNLYPLNINILEDDVGEGDTFNVAVDIKNPKGQGYDADLKIELLYPLSKVDEVDSEKIDEVKKQNIKVKAESTKKAGTFEFTIPEDDVEGRYRVVATVTTLYRKNEKSENKTVTLEVGEDKKNKKKTVNPRADGISTAEVVEDHEKWKSKISDGTLWLNVGHPAFFKEVVNAHQKQALRDYVFDNGVRCLNDLLMEKKVDEIEDKDEIAQAIEDVRLLADELEAKHLGGEIDA